jgi:cyanate lyase
MSMTLETAEKAAVLFGLDTVETELRQAIPYRGSLPGAVPTDPLVYLNWSWSMARPGRN